MNNKKEREVRIRHFSSKLKHPKGCHDFVMDGAMISNENQDELEKENCLFDNNSLPLTNKRDKNY